MKKIFLVFLLCIFAFCFDEESSYVHFNNVNEEYRPHVKNENVPARTCPSIQHSKKSAKFSFGKKNGEIIYPRGLSLIL